MPADPDLPCPHLNFAAFANVTRLSAVEGGPVTVYSCSLRVDCTDCGERFRWMGVPAGLSPAHPTCDVGEFELRAPLRPATSDPDFGMGIPGFAINFLGPE